MTQEQPQSAPLELRTFVEILSAVREGHDDFLVEEKEVPARDLKQVFVSPHIQELVFAIRFFEKYCVRAPGERLWGLPRNYAPHHIIGTPVAFADIPTDKQRAFSLSRKDDQVKAYALTRAGTYLQLKQGEILIAFEDIGGIEGLIR